MLIIYSGGLDSTVLLYQMFREYSKWNVRALAINYGQRNVRELQSAAHICNLIGVPFEIADLTCLQKLIPGNAMLDPTIMLPQGITHHRL